LLTDSIPLYGVGVDFYLSISAVLSSLFSSLFLKISYTVFTMTAGVTQPPYPLHESVKDLLDPEYVAFYNEHVINNQQVHLQPVDASRTSGVLIPGAGPMLNVGKTQDITVQRRATEGPPILIRAFTPKGHAPPAGWPVMLYFHGGGWVLGNIDTENVVCSNLCVRGNCVVITVDYR
jgi:acetyl esterase/lipase